MSESAPTYHVTVTREDGLWVAVVRDLPAGATDVERITDLETEVRDLIATLREVDPYEFDIKWHYEHAGHDFSGLITTLRERERNARDAVRKRDEARTIAITRLHDAGLSLREIAEILGLSHQRVQQLSARAAADRAGEPCATV
ncbi:hypothetical protein [Saccharomonospora iraqiensis]|uniref:hypothetical protein n=1 Tax=Saccharomonospora iraqiensis TaxID=52698 RepID=UPI0004104EDC|nr:hypothetical protein [Saccharomonospora iraqiensis]